MKCKICSRDNKKYVQINNGTICPECFFKMPLIIREDIELYTLKEINKLCGIIKKKEVEINNKLPLGDNFGILRDKNENIEESVVTDFINIVIDQKYWCNINNVYFSDNDLFISEKPLYCEFKKKYENNINIDIEGSVIKYKDIKDIKFNFHPKEQVSGKEVIGELTLVIRTCKPNVAIEIPIEKKYIIEYYIHGDDITYKFSNYGKYETMLLDAVNKVASGRKPNLSFFWKEYFLYKEKDEYAKYARYDNLNDYIKAFKEGKTDSYKDNKQSKQEEKNNKKENTNKEKTLSDFEKAKKMFNVEIPYSEEKIKKKRNELIKKVHPDEGGDVKKAATINYYYDLLRKFVV